MRIFVVVQHSDNQFKMRMEMEEFLYQMRIDAELIVGFLKKENKPLKNYCEISYVLKFKLSEN